MLHYEIASKIVKFGKDFTEEERKTGKVKYFAQRVHRSRVGIKYVTDEIVQRTSLTRGDVTNVIMTLSEVVNSLLMEGIAVDLGDLGSLSVEANGKYVDEARAVTADTIKKPQVRYTPKHEMRRFAQRVRISVRKPGEDEPKPPVGGSGGSDTEGGGGSRRPEGGLPL